MNKSLLTLGTILSLGTFGCAGFGLQQSSSLGAQFQNHQGLDELWHASERPAAQGLEAPRYAEQGLSDLWNDGGANGLEAVRDDGSAQAPNQGDLWNPASVTRSWEIDETSKPSPSRGFLYGESLRRGTWY